MKQEHNDFFEIGTTDFNNDKKLNLLTQDCFAVIALIGVLLIALCGLFKSSTIGTLDIVFACLSLHVIVMKYSRCCAVGVGLVPIRR